MTFRAGDTVHHGPSGANLLLAADEAKSILYTTTGSTYSARECTLTQAADDEQRVAMLTSMAQSSSWTWVCMLAKEQLAALQPAPLASAPISPVTAKTPYTSTSFEIVVPWDVVELTDAERDAYTAELEAVTYATLERLRPGTAAKLKAWLQAHR